MSNINPIETVQALSACWSDAYAAFQGAFDTPQTRRQQADEYSQDARSRLRDFDERFRALLAQMQSQPSDEREAFEAHAANGLAWAVSRWEAEVSQRPLVNVHRRALDDTWRQVVRYFGGDPGKLLGPPHDELRSRMTTAEWSAALGPVKAQQEPVAQPFDQKCLPDGIRPLVGITLNARQLHQAWEFANPDPGDEDQEETDVTIRWFPGGKDTDGEDAPAGYYAHISEYPEEGALLLDPEQPIDAAPPAAHQGAQPAVPEGWKLVPEDCTDEQAEAIAAMANCCGGIAESIYRAALASAPSASAQPQCTGQNCAAIGGVGHSPECMAEHDAIVAQAAQEPQGEAQQPVAWVRFCSDGTIEGPLLNGQIDEVRKKSGAWTPLVAQQQESRKPLTEERISAAFDEHDKTHSLVASVWSFEAGVRWAEEQHGIGTGASKEVNDGA